jgi:vancomycin permeability regulator SanA
MKKRNISDVIIATDPYHCNRTITMAEAVNGLTTAYGGANNGPNGSNGLIPPIFL